MAKIDALSKYRNQLLSVFNVQQLAEMKRANWSGLLEQTDQLYATMYHDWDVLQKDSNDLAEAVQTLEWTVAPYVADGEEATPEAQEVAKVVTDALWKRTPQGLGSYSHTFTQLIGSLVHGLFRGFNVHEIEWKNDGNMVYPAAFHQLPAQYMRWEDRAGHPDKLLFVADGETAEAKPFPAHKYIVGLNTSGPDHPIYNATYYSLVAWFGAYKFGLGWFMEYCQKYGIPKLVFHYESPSDRKQLEKDLAEERVLNNILLKGDRSVDIANAPASGASLPQRELLNLAESACHKLILGQTLTSDTSDHGGSLAQAKVHAGVQADIVKKRADYVADVLNSQLIPAIVLLNYGKLDVPMPELRCKIPQAGVTLERVQVVKTALEIQGMKLKKSEVYEFTGFAQPAEGDDVFEAAAAGDDAMGGLASLLGATEGKQGGKPDPDDDPDKPKKKAPAPKEEEDAEPVTAAKTDTPEQEEDPAQAWIAPIKEKFLEARKNGASMAELQRMLLTLHPRTKALAEAFAKNILAGLKGEEGEAVDAANPYGCNQYGEGWKMPHNGMQTMRRRKDAMPAPDTSKLDELKVDDDDDSPEAMEKRKQRFALHKKFAEEMEKRLQEWLKGRGDKVKAAAGTEDDKRPFPVQMPDGSMCHTYNCECHKGADEIAIKEADKKLDELMRQAKEAFQKGQMTKLQKIMEEHASWRSYVEKIMAFLGLKKNKVEYPQEIEDIYNSIVNNSEYDELLKRKPVVPSVDEVYALWPKEAVERYKKGIATPDDMRQIERYQKARQEYMQAKAEEEAWNREVKEFGLNIVELPPEERGNTRFNFLRRWKKEKKAHVQSSLDDLMRITSKNLAPETIDITNSGKPRSYHLNGTVYLSDKFTSVTPAHEAVHAIERLNEDLNSRSIDYVLRRAGNEEPKPLYSLTGDSRYGSKEYAFEDSFARNGNNAYCGKVYASSEQVSFETEKQRDDFMALSNEERKQRIRTTDLLTMGVERVITDAAKFAREDPDYFKFVLTTLRK